MIPLFEPRPWGFLTPIPSHHSSSPLPFPLAGWRLLCGLPHTALLFLCVPSQRQPSCLHPLALCTSHSPSPSEDRLPPSVPSYPHSTSLLLCPAFPSGLCSLALPCRGYALASSRSLTLGPSTQWSHLSPLPGHSRVPWERAPCPWAAMCPGLNEAFS